MCVIKSSVAQPVHQLLASQLQQLCTLQEIKLETDSHEDSVEGPKDIFQKTRLWSVGVQVG